MVSFVRSDHIGRPVFATDSSGVKVSTGTPPNARFPGQWFQSETGLHQNWMRDYDPTTGRYMQADPLGLIDGASVYGYAGRNPGRYVDPRGEFFVPGAIVGAAIGGIGGYIQTGCWQGAAAGAAIGAVMGGFLPVSSAWAVGAVAGGEAFMGQAVAYRLSQQGICSCNQQKWNWTQATSVTLGAGLGGAGGYFFGGTAGSAFGVGTGTTF